MPVDFDPRMELLKSVKYSEHIEQGEVSLVDKAIILGKGLVINAKITTANHITSVPSLFENNGKRTMFDSASRSKLQFTL